MGGGECWRDWVLGGGLPGLEEGGEDGVGGGYGFGGAGAADFGDVSPEVIEEEVGAFGGESDAVGLEGFAEGCEELCAEGFDGLGDGFGGQIVFVDGVADEAAVVARAVCGGVFDVAEKGDNGGDARCGELGVDDGADECEVGFERAGEEAFFVAEAVDEAAAGNAGFGFQLGEGCGGVSIFPKQKHGGLEYGGFVEGLFASHGWGRLWGRIFILQ